MTTTLSSKHTMNDGCNIHYSHHVNEGKPTVVLSNSLGTTMDMWNPQLNALKAEYSVLTYDTRGHGGSDVFPGGYSLDRLGCDVIELLDALNLERVHFCGLSIGGMTGQWLVNRCPDRLDSLILANTSAYIGPSSMWKNRIEQVVNNGIESVWEAVVVRWFSESFINSNSDIIDNMKSMLLSIDPQGYAGCCAAIRDMDLRTMFGKNALPTLIIAGTKDLATPVEQSYHLMAHYNNARLLELEAGHLSNIEQAEQFTSNILAFLAGK